MKFRLFFTLIFTFSILITNCSTLQKIEKKDIEEKNYPNMFSPSSSTSIVVNNPKHLLMTLYDIKGTILDTIIDGKIFGSIVITPNLSKLNSGVYFFKISSSDTTYTKKFVLMK